MMEQNKKNILVKLNTLRENKYLCDVTLVVEEERFPCHRVVLASGSSYFYAMFEHNFKEKTSDEITLKGLSSNGFEDILKYIYVNEVNIKGDNVKNLLMASDMLGIETLQASCVQFIEDGNGVNDLVDLFIYAQLLDNSKLAEKLKGFICEKFSDICDSGSWVYLSYKQLKLILESEDLTVEKEETVFHIVLKWLKFNNETRLKYMEELIPLIEVPSLMSEDMINLLQNEPIIQNDKKFRDMVVKRSVSGLCKTYKKPKKEFCEPRFMLFSRKFPNSKEVVPEVFQGNQIVQSFDQLSFETSYLRSVVLNKNTLFVLWKNGNQLEFQKIDLDSCECINLKRPPVDADMGGYSLQAGGSGIYLYVEYITIPSIISTRFWLYDLTLDVWSGIPDLKINDDPLEFSCFRVHKNKLYIIGGCYAPISVYSFDIRENVWETLPSMNSPKNYASACFFHENLYVCERQCSDSKLDVEIFDLNHGTRKWKRTTFNIPKSVYSIHSMFSANNKLYLIGHSHGDSGTGRKASISISSSVDQDEILRFDEVKIDRDEIVAAILLDC